MSANLAIRVVDASVRRGRREIIREVSLSVAAGEILAVVGPNGAGKSTLLSLIAGELRPAAGEVELMGRPVSEYRPQPLARVRSILLQTNQVSFPFQVRDVVQMGRNPWSGAGPDKDDHVVVGLAMEQMGVEALSDRRFNELSGGERARVSLARVLAQDTDVVLLDEPTAALDLHHQDRVMAVVRGLANRGRAVIVVVHGLSIAAAYADRIGVLVEGELTALGDVSEVITPEVIGEAYGVVVDVIQSPDGTPLVVPRRAR